MDTAAGLTPELPSPTSSANLGPEKRTLPLFAPGPLLTPVNVAFFILVASLLYNRLRTPPPQTLPRPPDPILFKTYTPKTLLPNNGTNNNPVFLAVRSRVFDVTPGRNFYGPGGPYENFAGRDATRGLACGSFDEDMLTKDLEGPLDKLAGLGDEEMESLRGWEERFLEKYLVVGRLVAEGEEGKDGS